MIINSCSHSQRKTIHVNPNTETLFKYSCQKLNPKLVKPVVLTKGQQIQRTEDNLNDTIGIPPTWGIVGSTIGLRACFIQLINCKIKKKENA